MAGRRLTLYYFGAARSSVAVVATVVLTAGAKEEAEPGDRRRLRRLPGPGLPRRADRPPPVRPVRQPPARRRLGRRQAALRGRQADRRRQLRRGRQAAARQHGEGRADRGHGRRRAVLRRVRPRTARPGRPEAGAARLASPASTSSCRARPAWAARSSSPGPSKALELEGKGVTGEFVYADAGKITGTATCASGDEAEVTGAASNRDIVLTLVRDAAARGRAADREGRRPEDPRVPEARWRRSSSPSRS